LFAINLFAFAVSNPLMQIRFIYSGLNLNQYGKARQRRTGLNLIHYIECAISVQGEKESRLRATII